MPARAVAAPAEIAPDALLQHIKFLSSDELKGRATAPPNSKRPATYVARQFKAVGLQPGGTSDEWFQPFQLIAGLTVGSGNRLSVSAKGRTVNFTLGVSYYPLSAPSNEDPAKPSSDLRGAAARLRRLRPRRSRRRLRRLQPHRRQRQSRPDLQPRAAGARRQQSAERRPPDAADDARVEGRRSHAARARRCCSSSAIPHTRSTMRRTGCLRSDPDAEDHGIPVLRIRRAEAQPLIDAWQLDAAARQIDADLVPRSRDLAGREGRLRRASREESPHRAERDWRAARQRPGPGARKPSSSAPTTITSASAADCR